MKLIQPRQKWVETFADSLFDISADALGVPAHGVHNYLCHKYYTHVEDASTVLEPQYSENIAHISSKHSHMKREETFFLSSFPELYYISSYSCVHLHDIYWSDSYLFHKINLHHFVADLGGVTPLMYNHCHLQYHTQQHLSMFILYYL